MNKQSKQAKEIQRTKFLIENWDKYLNENHPNVISEYDTEYNDEGYDKYGYDEKGKRDPYEYEKKNNPEIFNNLINLSDKEISTKIKQAEEDAKRNTYSGQDDPSLYTIMNIGQKIIRDRKQDKYEETYNKFKGQPFMDSTISDIGFPDEKGDGKFDTLSVHLMKNADEDGDYGDKFQYNFSYPEFIYYIAGGGYKRQAIDNPVEPADALLNSNDMKVLNMIIRLNNFQHTKMPYPRQATLKDSEKHVNPSFSTADFQWMVGQGDETDKVTEVSIHNSYNEKKDYEMNTGFLLLHVTVGEGWDSENYTYHLSFDAFGNPTSKEKLEHRYAMGKDEVPKAIYSGAYDPIKKAIEQINPKSKVLNNIHRITRSN